MKMYASKTFFLLGLFLLTAQLHAQAYDMWDKGGRGLANILTSPYEIVRQGKIDYEAKGGVGIFSGGFRGLFYVVGRIVVGAYELITFPIPLPAGYEPIFRPEYVIPATPRAKTTWGEGDTKHVY